MININLIILLLLILVIFKCCNYKYENYQGKLANMSQEDFDFDNDIVNNDVVQAGPARLVVPIGVTVHDKKAVNTISYQGYDWNLMIPDYEIRKSIAELIFTPLLKTTKIDMNNTYNKMFYYLNLIELYSIINMISTAANNKEIDASNKWYDTKKNRESEEEVKKAWMTAKDEVAKIDAIMNAFKATEAYNKAMIEYIDAINAQEKNSRLNNISKNKDKRIFLGNEFLSWIDVKKKKLYMNVKNANAELVKANVELVKADKGDKLKKFTIDFQNKYTMNT